MSPVEKPTQADREAAAAYYASHPFGSSKARELEKIEQREARDHVDALVLLFMRHRLAADQAARTTTTEGEAIAWLEAQAKQSRTGISFDWVPACEGEPSGYRFMRHHHIGQPCKSIADAIRQNGGPA